MLRPQQDHLLKFFVILPGCLFLLVAILIGLELAGGLTALLIPTIEAYIAWMLIATITLAALLHRANIPQVWIFHPSAPPAPPAQNDPPETPAVTTRHRSYTFRGDADQATTLRRRTVTK